MPPSPPSAAAVQQVSPGSPGMTDEGLFDLVAPDLQKVEELLRERMQSAIGTIPEVGAHLLLAGGKRLRPLLAVLAARATGTDPALALAVGCAAELIHTATLYHDDVVDDGRVRRGRPAARLVFGNGIVVLVGDFCLARALETVADTGSLPLVQSLAATVTEMAEGEVAQLERAGQPRGHHRRILRRHRPQDRLADRLVRAGGRRGSRCASTPTLARYGRAVGRAFQIADDILDCAGAESVAGKSVGHDLQGRQADLAGAAGLRGRPQPARAPAPGAGRAGDLGRRPPTRCWSRCAQVGGVDRARARALAMADEALADLQALAPSRYRDALAALARMSVERVS